MTALLTDNLPLLAGAPNGIKELRELILELAVRGKLVPQDPNDEPASELLKQIVEEKARLVAEGKIKKQKPLAEIAEEEKPFGLPNGWSWTSLGEIAAMRGGSTPSMSKSEFWGGDIPWVSPKDMHDGVITDSELKVTQSALDKTSLELVPIGSVLLVGRSGILKRKLPVQITAVPCTINQDLKAISPFQPLPSRYVQLMLRGTARIILLEDVKQGTTVQSVVYDKLFARPFGLPPLAEQHRIVAKVDELMALCDRLEAQQADAESAHARLLQALLDSMIQASDATDFAANWQRLAEHFHTLFNTESSIDALKQTLLQLAVMGKLVPQDPSDEPASELIKKIDSEKSRQVKAGKFKPIRQVSGIEDADKPFPVPATWGWARLADVAFQITDGAHHTPTYTAAGVPFLSVKDMSGGRLDFNATRYISEEAHEQLTKRCHPQRGDLLLTKIGTTGVPVIVDTDRPFSIFVSVGLIKAPWDHLNVSYLQLLICSPFVMKQSLDGTEGVGNKNLVLKKIANFLIAIPPLAEQHRIVAKVDQLMALCNQLKTCLTQAREVNQQLASALVEKATA